MLRFHEAAVAEPVAHELLTAYFAERASTFPTPGGYRTTFPDPAQFEPPWGVFLVVYDGDQPVGCGGIRRLQDEPADGIRFEVKHLYLRNAARGRGAGRALLAELEQRAEALGATELVLDTNASLAAAGGLYRSAGYLGIAPYNDNPNATNWYGKRLSRAQPPES